MALHLRYFAVPCENLKLKGVILNNLHDFMLINVLPNSKGGDPERENNPDRQPQDVPERRPQEQPERPYKNPNQTPKDNGVYEESIQNR